MKTTIRILLGCLVLVATSLAASAQCPGNRAGCPNPEIINVTYPVVLSTGCVVEVAYQIKKCPRPPANVACEISIQGVTAIADAALCEQCDPVADGTSIKQITDEALRHILSRNRGTLPCGPIRDDIVAVSRPICWRHAMVQGRRVFIPCGGCCTILVRIVTNDQYTVFVPVIDPNTNSILDPGVNPNPAACPPQMPAGCTHSIPCPPPVGGIGDWFFTGPMY
jgi:hypothetical protein